MTADIFKPTNWTPLAAAECSVIERNEYGGVRVRHPQLPRPRWFNPARRGNLVSRYTGKATDFAGLGYVINGALP